MAFIQNNIRIRESVFFLVRSLFVGSYAAVVGTAIVLSFVFLLDIVSAAIEPFSAYSFLFPLAGALLCGMVFYRINPEAAGEGIPSYIRSMQFRKGYFSLKVTVLKYFSALATIASYGSGGIIGPLGRVSAGIISFSERFVQKLLFKKEDDDQMLSSICGMAAAIGAITHAPIGAGIFAVEIIQKNNFSYRDLFPAILSSVGAVVLSQFFGFPGLYHGENSSSPYALSTLVWILPVSLVIGLAGLGYNSLYRIAVKVFNRRRGRVWLKVLIGSALSGAICFFVSPSLFGVSRGLLHGVFAGDFTHLAVGALGSFPIVIVLLVLAISKAVTNTITVGSGLNAGFTAPTAIAGMLIAAAIALLLGFQAGSPDYFMFVVIGFSGILAASMNIPFAAAILAIEIFGVQYAVPAAIAVVVGYYISQTSNIYTYAIEAMNGKE
ncbi:MAG: chloride channel protein [Spirochaetales bacterium]|nr:chloride channel protein [Spirochaetales bacterium]